MITNHEKCLICKPKNKTLYFHIDKTTNSIWLYCCKCARGYSLQDYCSRAGITAEDFLSNTSDIDFSESAPNELRKMVWPSAFISLHDPRAKKGLDYVNSRGLIARGDLFYDLEEEGIVFPYYYDNLFCGAQIRFLEERINEEGEKWKITTLPETKLGLLIYSYNQTNIMPNVKAFIVCEGAFNALSLQQALDELYGSQTDNPFKAVACSGSGASDHHLETFKELKERGYKIILASDRDQAGVKMLKKYVDANAVTDFAFTDESTDWNDLLKTMGRRQLATYFLRRITRV